jgi:hypothetical protein
VKNDAFTLQELGRRQRPVRTPDDRSIQANTILSKTAPPHQVQQAVSIRSDRHFAAATEHFR